MSKLLGKRQLPPADDDDLEDHTHNQEILTSPLPRRAVKTTKTSAGVEFGGDTKMLKEAAWMRKLNSNPHRYLEMTIMEAVQVVKQFLRATMEESAEMLAGPLWRSKLLLTRAVNVAIANANLEKLKLLVAAGADLQQTTNFTVYNPFSSSTSDQRLPVSWNASLYPAFRIRPAATATTSANKLDIIRYLLGEYKISSTDGENCQWTLSVVAVNLLDVELLRFLLDRDTPIGAQQLGAAMLQLLAMVANSCNFENGSTSIREIFKLLIYRGANYDEYAQWINAPAIGLHFPLRNSTTYSIDSSQVRTTHNSKMCELWKKLSRPFHQPATSVTPTPTVHADTASSALANDNSKSQLSVEDPYFACLFPDERDHHLAPAQKYLNQLLTSWRVGNDIVDVAASTTTAIVVADITTGDIGESSDGKMEKVVDLGKQQNSAAAINWARKQCEQVVRQEVFNSSPLWIPPLANLVCSFFVAAAKCQE